VGIVAGTYVRDGDCSSVPIVGDVIVQAWTSSALLKLLLHHRS